MGAGQKNFRKRFASASPGFFPARRSHLLYSFRCLLLLAAGLAPAVLLPVAGAEGSSSSTGKREAAAAQFAKAEELRASLDQKPANERTLAEYKQVAAAYRRVALITPRAPEVPDSLLCLGEVYTEMGDRFGRSYYQSAADSYLFLVREYPGNRHSQDAMLRAARLERDNLSDAEHAAATYNDFLKRFPRSPHKREAQEALAELALLRSTDAPAETAAAPPQPKYAADEADAASKGVPARHAKRNDQAEPENSASSPADSDESPRSGGQAAVPGGYVPRIRRIRASATPQSTRVVIDIEDSVQYTSGRVASPDRIFFDLHAARLSPELLRGKVAVEGELLSAVRIAQNQAGVVRVVLDISGVKDYTASLTHSPTQLLIDLYPGEKAPVRTAKARGNPNPEGASDKGETAPREDGHAPVMARPTERPTEPDRTAGPAPRASSAILNSAGSAGAVRTAEAKSSSPVPTNNSSAAPAASMKGVKASAPNRGGPEPLKPASPPQPTRDGNSTLTRVLGLKIGRIVIDPGHGGHDTGTIGPTGLMEKDLCLDVALRLGKIIQQRLPGADVVFTRSDDTFIPLEERTAMANQAKADLFVSIHANSSPDHAARGVETYYLNLKGSPEAMEVAARENAVSQTGIHNLEDLVKRITQTEKMDESKEFAEDVQVSLSQRIQKTVKTVKNRGVRKAPFVVLIGADMPSILTEVSFLSNPADESLLKKPEHRQRVAEGIYQGMANYLQSLNSMVLNLPARASQSAERPVEQSRNNQK